MNNNKYHSEFLKKIEESEAKEALLEDIVNKVIKKLLETGLAKNQIKSDLEELLKEAQDNTKTLQNIEIVKQILKKR